MRKNFARAAITLAAIAFLSPATAQSVAGSLAKGRTHFAATAGTGESNVYRKCDSTYAEISVTFAF